MNTLGLRRHRHRLWLLLSTGWLRRGCSLNDNSSAIWLSVTHSVTYSFIHSFSRLADNLQKKRVPFISMTANWCCCRCLLDGYYGQLLWLDFSLVFSWLQQSVRLLIELHWKLVINTHVHSSREKCSFMLFFFSYLGFYTFLSWQMCTHCIKN